MKHLKDMTKDELRQEVEDIALYYAQQAYLANNPGATEDQATVYAKRHWRNFWQDALEVFAVVQAQQEAQDAAPGN